MSWNRHLMGAAGCAPDDDFVLLPDPPRTSQDEFPEIFRLLLCNGYDLYEASIDQLQHLFSSGALSAAHYVQFCLDRVQKVKPHALLTLPGAALIASIDQSLPGMRHRDQSRCP